MRNFKIGIGLSLTSLVTILAATGAGCDTGSGSTTANGGTTGGGGTTTPVNTGDGGSTGGTTASGGTTGATGGTTASGGSTGTGGTATGTGGTTTAPVTTGVCAGEATRALTADQGKVDNFEGDTLSLGWSTFNDITGAPNSIKMTQDAGGALATGHFGHYAGTGAKTPVMSGYGVGAIYNVAIDKTAGTYCIDVTAFDGLTFWAKAAKANTKVGVNFVVPETNAVLDGGDCKTSCYLHPQKTVTIGTTWAQYSIAFSSAIGGTAKVQGRIQELGWLSPDSDWDFSIDEIQFYKGMPPTTPVAD